MKNVADDPRYADVKRDLAAKLDRWMTAHDDPFCSQHVTTRRGEKLA